MISTHIKKGELTITISERRIVTLSDLKYRDQVLNACCNKTETTIYKTVDRFGRERRIPKSNLNFIRNDINVKEVTLIKYHKKDLIAGVNIEISPVIGSQYSRGGIKIAFDCYGETPRQLKEDISIKEKKIVNYLLSFGIPVDRICAAMNNSITIGCINKYEKIESRLIEPSY